MIDLRDSHISHNGLCRCLSIIDLNQRSVRLSTPENNSLPVFYGKSSKNPYYSPLFDFIVGKALDLRKATSSLCLNH